MTQDTTKIGRKLNLAWVGLTLLGLAACTAAPRGPQAAEPSPLAVFQQRLAYSRSHLGPIIVAAEAVAARVHEHPTALIDVPDRDLTGWPDELINRAGGLANCVANRKRPGRQTPHDIALMGVRSWEQDLPTLAKMIERSRQQGQLVVLFASRAGMPADVTVDYLIDNGAPSGAAVHAPANAIANVLNGWLWTCEYAAALTRHGRYPGVLMSIALPGAAEYDDRLQTPEGRTFLGECTTPVAAGILAAAYLQRVDRLLVDLRSRETQREIDRAAAVIAGQLETNGTVWIASCGHMLMYELSVDRRTPMKPLRVSFRPQAIAANVQPGDLYVWIGYRGLGTTYDDHATQLRQARARVVASFTPDDDPRNNAPGALAIIRQHWVLPDAEVKIPFPPGVMAPVSGLEQPLVYRLLEEAVAARLPAELKTAQALSLERSSSARFAAGGAWGTVREVAADQHGNLMTTFVDSDLQQLGISLTDRFVIQFAGKTYDATYASGFGDVPEGAWLILKDDDYYYVLAVRGRNAAQIAGVKRGDAVFIRKQ